MWGHTWGCLCCGFYLFIYRDVYFGEFFLSFFLSLRWGPSFRHHPGLSLHAEAGIRHRGQRLLDEKVRAGAQVGLGTALGTGFPLEP